jgi:hypothetical protein
MGTMLSILAPQVFVIHQRISLIRTEAELALRRSRGEAEYKEALQHILLGRKGPLR